MNNARFPKGETMQKSLETTEHTLFYISFETVLYICILKLDE